MIDFSQVLLKHNSIGYHTSYRPRLHHSNYMTYNSVCMSQHISQVLKSIFYNICYNIGIWLLLENLYTCICGNVMQEFNTKLSIANVWPVLNKLFSFQKYTAECDMVSLNEWSSIQLHLYFSATVPAPTCTLWQPRYRWEHLVGRSVLCVIPKYV